MIRVVAGIIIKKDKVLIARRAPHKSMAGKWEFPGGKIEDDESPEEALERELFEEFKVRTKTGNYLASNEHDYGDFKIELTAFYSTHLEGVYRLSDHDQIEWVDKNDLKNYDLAEADIPIVIKIENLFNE